MSFSFFRHFADLIKRNGIFITIFLVSVLLCTVVYFLDFFLTALILCAVLAAALILYIKVSITEYKLFYRILKYNNVSAPKKLYINSLLSVFIIFTLIFTLTIGCCTLLLNSDTTIGSAQYSETELSGTAMSEEDQKLLKETVDALAAFEHAFVKKGYASPMLYLTLFIVFTISTLALVIRWHTALSFASKSKLHPLVMIILSLLVISIANDFIVSILSSLVSLTSPGLTTAIAELQNYITISNTHESAVNMIIEMATKLPEATTLIKILIISELCTLVAAFTNALVAMKYIEGKKQVNENNKDKN